MSEVTETKSTEGQVFDGAAFATRNRSVPFPPFADQKSKHFRADTKQRESIRLHIEYRWPKVIRDAVPADVLANDPGCQMLATMAVYDGNVEDSNTIPLTPGGKPRRKYEVEELDVFKALNNTTIIRDLDEMAPAYLASKADSKRGGGGGGEKLPAEFERVATDIKDAKAKQIAAQLEGKPDADVQKAIKEACAGITPSKVRAVYKDEANPSHAAIKQMVDKARADLAKSAEKAAAIIL